MKINKGADGNDVPLLFYTFKSTKTNKVYHALIEIHPFNFYAIKFYLKDHKKCKCRYNIETHLNEARPVINTCIKIMLDLYNKKPNSSFGFIGSNSLKEVRLNDKQKVISDLENPESECNTQRYRIYKTLMLTYFPPSKFKHMVIEEKSAYVLICNDSLILDKDLVDKLNSYFNSNYLI